MHCNICDKQLDESDIVWNDDLKKWEPCKECLEIIYDAAYQGQFTKEDPVETLEPEFDFSGEGVDFSDDRLYNL